MSTKHALIIHAVQLEGLASQLSNEDVRHKLTTAAFTMREAAAEIESLDSVPAWLVPLQDTIYALTLSVIHAGWTVRSAVVPGAKTFNIDKFAIDSYERLLKTVSSNVFATTRASRQYPHTTRRKDIRKALTDYAKQRRNS